MRRTSATPLPTVPKPMIAKLAIVFLLLLFLCRAPRGTGSFFFSMARDLRGPGLRAYFCPPAKVGKNGLRKLRFLRTFLHYGGVCFAPEAQFGLV